VSFLWSRERTRDFARFKVVVASLPVNLAAGRVVGPMCYGLSALSETTVKTRILLFNRLAQNFSGHATSMIKGWGDRKTYRLIISPWLRAYNIGKERRLRAA
jgi:hypothetical protein